MILQLGHCNWISRQGQYLRTLVDQFVTTATIEQCKSHQCYCCILCCRRGAWTTTQILNEGTMGIRSDDDSHARLWRRCKKFLYFCCACYKSCWGIFLELKSFCKCGQWEDSVWVWTWHNTSSRSLMNLFANLGIERRTRIHILRKLNSVT